MADKRSQELTWEHDSEGRDGEGRLARMFRKIKQDPAVPIGKYYSNVETSMWKLFNICCSIPTKKLLPQVVSSNVEMF